MCVIVCVCVYIYLCIVGNVPLAFFFLSKDATLIDEQQ